MLLSGLLLKIIAVILIIVLGGGESLVQTPFDTFIRGVSIWKALLFICVLTPIAEEFSFRYWAKGSVIARFYSIVGMSLIAGIAFNWWIAIIAAVLLSGLMFVIKDKYARLVTLTIVTSFLFGACHVDKFYSFDAIIPYLMSIVGFGLIAVYCVLR